MKHFPVLPRIVVLLLLLLAGGWALPVPAAAPATASAGTAYAAKFNIPWTPKKREFRAVWITTAFNTDWPSKSNLSVAQQQAEFRQLLDEAVSSGMNAVIVQIRPMGDAFYSSRYAPWSAYLSGQQGKPPQPYYDPLHFMVAEAHVRNLEFHAWFNPFRIGISDSVSKLAASHPARKLAPAALIIYDGRLYLNPGEPAVRQFVIDTIMEAVSGYDIDAVHLDDYFYPHNPDNSQSFPDSSSYKAQNKGRFKSVADWRRDNINCFVRDLAKAVKARKSWVKFGISPFGIWRNREDDPTGSDTVDKLSSYDDLCADTRAWIRNGWIDYVIPQVYWYFGQPGICYEKILAFWSNEAKRNPRVQLYIGHALYKVGKDPRKAWQNREEIPNQLRYNQYFPEVCGSAFYSMSALRRDSLGVRTQLGGIFYRPRALVPTMPWLGGTPPPPPPRFASARRESGTVHLSFGDAQAATSTAYYVVYRFMGSSSGSLAEPRNILATVRKQSGKSQEFIDRTAWAGCAYTYVVTAVDRLHNESTASTAIAIPR